MKEKDLIRNEKFVLVTGACGFIGSHLCEKLLKKGYMVLGIDSFTDFYPKTIKEKNIEISLKKSNFKFVETDILNLISVDKDIEYI